MLDGSELHPVEPSVTTTEYALVWSVVPVFAVVRIGFGELLVKLGPVQEYEYGPGPVEFVRVGLPPKIISTPGQTADAPVLSVPALAVGRGETVIVNEVAALWQPLVKVAYLV